MPSLAASLTALTMSLTLTDTPAPSPTALSFPLYVLAATVTNPPSFKDTTLSFPLSQSLPSPPPQLPPPPLESVPSPCTWGFIEARPASNVRRCAAAANVKHAVVTHAAAPVALRSPSELTSRQRPRDAGWFSWESLLHPSSASPPRISAATRGQSTALAAARPSTVSPAGTSVGTADASARNDTSLETTAANVPGGAANTAT
mmetsp:Transcript_31474/g.79015  ORF Transcript_31474/g.79015 Transcript_31474/m.79015 type:complete len:203 (-) Transcript_31474:340-948(-)